MATGKAFERCLMEMEAGRGEDWRRLSQKLCKAGFQNEAPPVRLFGVLDNRQPNSELLKCHCHVSSQEVHPFWPFLCAGFLLLVQLILVQLF